VARKFDFFRAQGVLFWALVFFLILVFLTGGGSRSNIQSLIILRPAALIFCGIGFWTLKWKTVQEHRFMFFMAAASFVLVGAHLVPLPPALWGALPGRALVTEIDKVAQLGAVWRPISMVPAATWNAFYALFVPLAVLLLGVQLSQEARFKLLPWLLGLGLISGFWGILQVVGAPEGPLYLYDVTNNGAAVGLFSNRNHQAILLATLFPMLAVQASTFVRSEEQLGFRLWLAIAAGLVLVPLMLVTGSRAGLILGVLGLLLISLVYRKPTKLTGRKRKIKNFDVRLPLAAFAVVCIGSLTIIMSRAEAFQRLFAAGQGEDERFKVWAPMAEMAWKYFPVGSGAGSFIEIYQIDELDALLGPTYYNHAHNDFLEVYMTLGLPGILLAAIGFYGFVRAAFPVLRGVSNSTTERAFARLGLAVILLLGLMSVVDYPLRTPSLACLFVVASIWMAGGCGKNVSKKLVLKDAVS
jgi:O-antigen ligase